MDFGQLKKVGGPRRKAIETIRTENTTGPLFAGLRIYTLSRMKKIGFRSRSFRMREMGVKRNMRVNRLGLGVEEMLFEP